MADEVPQVDPAQYAWERYVGKPRWASLWHQVDEVLKLQARHVLEIGPGPGLFKAVAGRFGVQVETLDVDPALAPDHVGPATALPFADGHFDAACAFQMLEHLPYDRSLAAFGEMLRVARAHVVLSLPDAKTAWPYALHVPTVGRVDLLVPRPALGARPHVFDGEHHWEVNKQGYALERVVADFSARAALLRTYRVPELPYHRFFVFEKQR